MKKNQFIEELITFSRNDIRKFLENKGKAPKLIPLMVKVESNK